MEWQQASEYVARFSLRISGRSRGNTHRRYIPGDFCLILVVMDSMGALKRYDANRLLLGIRENGIDESAPGANLSLAAQYPDRSLIWINPTNGAAMGIALNIGLHPVQLDPDFLAAGGSIEQYWWTYTVSTGRERRDQHECHGRLHAHPERSEQS